MNNYDKTSKRLMALFVVCVVIWFSFILTAVGVAAHFIIKFW